MITQSKDYFADGCGRCERFATAHCSARLWADGLAALRQLCLEAGLEETVKWGQPCYQHEKRNIAIIGAFRGDFTLSFFNAALMTDPEGILQKPGPNSQHAEAIRFTDAAQVEAMAPVIRAYLTEAMSYAQAGVTAPKAGIDLDLPDELVEALDGDLDLAEAFHALTPGRQRSYVILLGSAKTSATRVARIAKARPKILAGKGAMER
ncbi:MAG: hypothetical protein GC187_09735 [Alphaproteobacteria bacterium]|nr:hypothetical protein [Alphaproteobacteria bacterium]